MPGPHHSHRLRSGRVSEAGRGYLITTVTQQRQPVFTDFNLARLAIHELRVCDMQGFSHTLAFVLMPDHLHWLVQLQTGSLTELVKRFKSKSAAAINHQRHTYGTPIWQPGFHDHALRDGEDIQHMARYIVANPLRAELVTSVRAYPHWDAIWL